MNQQLSAISVPKHTRITFRALGTAVLLASLVLSSFAQTTNGRLEGSVQDQSGAVVPNAKISIVNLQTRAASEITSDPSGNFVFGTLPPGVYNLTAEAAGFRKSIVNNIELAVSGTVSQIVKLEVGQTTESVQVEANAVHVQTTESQVSNAINTKDVENLPQLNRTPITLAIFQPGVQIDVRAGQDSSFSHINGLRQGSNNTTLDGIDVNDSIAPRLGLSLTANDSDSVGEFRVVTEGGKAEYGRSAGGQIELISRTGTNTYHGNLYDYLRNTDLNANDFFNNQSGGAVPQLIRNLYGGSFGGPIKHDKLFIFGNFQGTRTHQQTVRNRTVPTDSAKLGIFKYTQGGAVQSYNFAAADPRHIGVDPAMAKLLALYPAPNNTDLGDGLNTAGYRFNNPSGSLEDQFTIRGDYHMNDKNTVFMRWSWQRNSSIDALNNADATYPGQPQGSQGGHRWGYAIGDNWTVTPSLINEFLFGHQSAQVAFNRPGRPAGPQITTNLFTDVYPSGFGQGRNSPVNDITDNLTKVKGSHTFKMGANIRRTVQYGFNFAGVYPNLTTTINNGNAPSSSVTPTGLNSTQLTTFQQLYNDVLARVDSVSQTFYSDLQAFQPAGAPRVRNFDINESGYFFQDDWRVNRKLTLNLGIRWEFNGIPTEENGLQGIVSNAALLNGVNTATDLTVQRSGAWFNHDWNNFAPRFGFAYDLTGDGKTAIRGNFGIFFDRTIGSALQAADGGTPGFAQTVQTFPNSNGGDIRFNDSYPLPVQPGAPVLTLPSTRSTSITLNTPNLRTGYVEAYSVNIQREVLRNTVVQAGYVGNRGVKLFMQVDENQPKIYGDFLNAFKEFEAYCPGSTCTGPTPSANNTLVRIFGTPAAAVTALGGATNFSRGLVGTVANNLDRIASNFNRYAAAGLPSNYLRNYPQFNQVIVGTNNGRSYFDSLQTSIRRTAGALQLQANYTFGKSMDNYGGEGNGFTSIIDSYNLRLNKGLSDFDRRHSFNATSLYSFPLGRGQRFGGGMNRLADTLLGGWQFGSLWIWQSGQPYSVSSQRATTAVPGASPGFTFAQYNGTDRSIGSVDRLGNGVFGLTAAQIGLFGFPDAGQIGNAGRNVFLNPQFFETDASLGKRFAITERQSITFRAEAYNVFNHPNFGFAAANLNVNNIVRNADGSVDTTKTTFGKFSQTLGTQVGGSSARTMQLALRYDF